MALCVSPTPHSSNGRSEGKRRIWSYQSPIFSIHESQLVIELYNILETYHWKHCIEKEHIQDVEWCSWFWSRSPWRQPSIQKKSRNFLKMLDQTIYEVQGVNYFFPMCVRVFLLPIVWPTFDMPSLQEFFRSIDFYTRALDKQPDARVYTNRSLVRIPIPSLSFPLQLQRLFSSLLPSHHTHRHISAPVNIPTLYQMPLMLYP